MTADVIAALLPKLWSIRGGEFSTHVTRLAAAMSAFTRQSVNVNGLGELSVGMEVIHRRYGRGVIILIMAGPPAIGNVQFEDGVHPLLLSPEFLTLPTGE